MPWKYNTEFKDCYQWNPYSVFIVVSFLNNHLSKKKITLFYPILCLWSFEFVQNGDSAPMISPKRIYQIPYQTNTISTTNKKSSEKQISFWHNLCLIVVVDVCATALSGMYHYLYHVYCQTLPTSLCSDNTQYLPRSTVIGFQDSARIQDQTCWQHTQHFDLSQIGWKNNPISVIRL